MSARCWSWTALFLALAAATASSGCGSSPADTPLGTGGASDDASAEATAVEGDSMTETRTGNDGGDAPSVEETTGEASMEDASGGDAGTAGEATACDGPGSRYVSDVVSFMFGPGQSFGQAAFPANIYGPPKGGGCCLGSVDVVSLGNGGSVTMAFAGNEIVDGPGPDFIVFENAFEAAGNPTNPFAELGTVAVSQDGVQWYAFPCTATQYPYGTCAGWHPVFANPDQNTIDPTDPATAGGDPFDLADLGLSWARYVRVTDRPDDDNVFDLDAVAIVHPRCP